MSDYAVRAASESNLEKFRTNGDGSILGLAIQHASIVYSAQVSQAFESLENVTQLDYISGVGTLDEVLPGMTVVVFSATTAKQKGICRIRKTPLAGTLYINPTSNIKFETGDVLTVVNTFKLWQRDMFQNSDGSLNVDYDIAFGAPFSVTLPRISPVAAVLRLTDGTVTFTPPSPALSACYSGATIVSYHYDAPGAASTSDMDTEHPSWTYAAAGEYRWSCTLTDSNGVETVSFRWVFVDPPNLPFKFKDCGINPSDDDWSFSFICLADVAESAVYDGALVVLYTDDYYNSEKASIGKMAGFENVMACGWIDGEATTYDSETGEVAFTVRGAGYWMSKLRCNPTMWDDATGTPTAWTQIENMTGDKAMAYLLSLCSTAPMVMDCFLSGDTTRVQTLHPTGEFFEQIKFIANKMFVAPRVNSYGQLVVERDSQLLSDDDRDSVPVIMDITTADRKDGLDIKKSDVTSKTSSINIGAQTFDGATVAMVYSRAPGGMGHPYGTTEPTYDVNYIISGQDELNRIVGCVLSAKNNVYQPFDITLPFLMRLFDVCPCMYATITVQAEDNPRGIELTNVRLIPRGIKYIEDEQNVFSTRVSFEIETFAENSVIGSVPGMENVDMSMPPMPDFGGLGKMPKFDGIPSYYPPAVPTGDDCISQVRFNSYTLAWDRSWIWGTDAVLSAYIHFPCMLRGVALGLRSRILINAQFFGDSKNNYHVYGRLGGTRLIGAENIGNGLWEFQPLNPIEIDEIEFALEPGLGSPVTYAPQSVISSGALNVKDGIGVQLLDLEVGKFYCIDGTGGPWYWAGFDPWNRPSWCNYLFNIGGGSGVVQGGYGKDGNNGHQEVRTDGNGIYGEQIGDTFYGRCYFHYTGIPVFILVPLGGGYADHIGTMGYVLRNAFVSGRYVQLNAATLTNVCPVT